MCYRLFHPEKTQYVKEQQWINAVKTEIQQILFNGDLISESAGANNCRKFVARKEDSACQYWVSLILSLLVFFRPHNGHHGVQSTRSLLRLTLDIVFQIILVRLYDEYCHQIFRLEILLFNEI